MPIKKENQVKAETSILTSLANFQLALQDINANLEEIFAQIRIHFESVKEQRYELKRNSKLWTRDDANQHLEMIMFLAALRETQYLDYENILLQVSRVEDKRDTV